MAQSHNPSLITQNLAFCGDPAVKSVGGAGSRLYDQANVDSASVKLLIHGNEGSGQSFTDSSLSNHTITSVGGATHSNTQSKFPGGSFYLDGGDYLTIAPSSDFDFGTGSFTIDAWIRRDNLTNDDTIWGNGVAEASATAMWYFNGAGELRFVAANTTFLTTSSAGIAINNWYHIALVKDGTTLTTYVNGVSKGSATVSGSFGSASQTMHVGARDTHSAYIFTGYMDEFRVTKGVALWTQNFTPPARRDTLSISDGMMYNGTYLDFDGSNDYVANTSFTGHQYTDSGTIVAWAKADALGGYVFGVGGTTTGGSNRVFRIYNNRWSVVTYANDYNNFAGIISTGRWYHIACVWSGTSLTAYIDGVGYSTTMGGMVTPTGTNVVVGSAPWLLPSSCFDGQVADARVYDVALSAANIKELYNDSKVIVPSNVAQTNLKCWFPLVEGAGTIAYDGSGNGKDGTLTNMDAATDWLTGQTGCPQLITGYNRPMKFDASNDYVQVASNGLTDFANQSFTISAWVNMPDVTPSGHDRVIFSYDYTAHSQPYYAIHLRVAATSGALEFYWNNGSVYQGITKSSPPLTDDTWHHIAGTFTSGSQKLYIDGVEVASGTNTTTISFYNQEVWIGRANFGGYWNGMINEVAYFKSALSASEIKALASRITLGESLNSSVLITNSSYPMTWLSGASTTGVAGESDGVGLDAFNTTDSLVFVEGQRYRLSYNGNIIAGGGLEFAIVDQVVWTVTKTGFGSIVTKNGANVKEWVSTQSGTFVAVWYCNAASCKFVVSDFSIVPIGEPSPPDAMAMGDDVAGQISAKSTNADESTYSYGGTTYKTWTYRSGGTFVVPRDIEVDVVVVAGGGGGGYNVGGGGGAGGLVSETLVAAPGTYTVTVGAGGLGRHASMSPPQCTSGGDSSVDFAAHSRAWPYAAITTTAVGGGRGGGYITSWSDGPQSGGSGGGGRHSQGGAAGTAGQGNAGGSGTSSGGQYAGAGGGGAGAVGANAVFSSPNITAGDGGNGKNDFINSSAAETAALLAAALPTVGGGYLAGGGGGSRQGAGTTGAGGLGGGGKGSYYSTADGENGQVNTGGGGGGEMDGGSGVVIIRYAVPPVGGYWRNDGNSSWKDLSGNGNTGTVSGSPSTVLLKQGYTPSKSTNEGRDNQGFPLKYKDVGAIGNFFAASTTNTPHVNFGIGTRASSILCGDDFTFSTWINLTGGINGGTNYTILSNEVYQASGVILRVDGGSANIYLRTNTSGAAEASRTNNDIISSTTGWTYLSVIKQGTAVNFYLNGVLLINDISGSHTNAVTPTRPLSLGCSTAGTPYSVYYQPFVGDIGSSKIYDRALTQAEIKQNFAAQANRFQVPRSIVTEGLVLNLDAGNPGSYPGSGTAWYDVSGNGCDFTLDGSGITYSASNGGIFSLTDPSNGGASTTSAITASTSCTLVFWMKTTDAQALFWSGPAVDGDYLGAYRSGNKFYNAAALGSPTFYTNAVQRSNIYDFIRTGEWMMMEFKSVDMSSLTASHFNQYASYTFGGSSAVGKIMIYNRNLTSAESAQNFRVDRERFGV